MPEEEHNDNWFDQTRMPFGDHLEELRTCLIRALLGVAVTTVLSLIFAKKILEFILAPAIIVLHAHGERAELQALSPQEPFLLYLKTGFFSGLILAMPWVMIQAWSFIGSGLYEREQRFARRFAPVSVLLFATGVAFMFFIVLPIVLNFFVTFSQGFEQPSFEKRGLVGLIVGDSETPEAPDTEPNGLRVAILDHNPDDAAEGSFWINIVQRSLNLQTPAGIWYVPLERLDRARSVSSQYGLQFFVTFAFTLALGFGIAFELPVLVVFLAATGLVSTEDMARARRFVIFGIVIASAILTPPDIISQLLLALPMIVLFEAGLRVGKRFEHNRET